MSHHNGELFALRRLLSVVKGAVQFEDLATVRGTIYPSFRDACKARGMLSDDAEIIAALQEIVETTVSVGIIRQHFVTLLINSAPADPQAIFHHFIDDLCDVQDGENAVDVALLAIEAEMQSRHRSLEDTEFGFVLPEENQQRQFSKRRRLSHWNATVIEAARLRDELLPQFTAEQDAALHQIVDAIQQDQESKVFGLICSAGCGKTIFANGLASFLRASNRSVICVAASALAAMLLSQGVTAHSAFHIPIPANEYTMCNLSTADREYIKTATLIIYDECSMVHRDVADTVERSLRDIMQNNLHFGGKSVLFMGDFKQLLPVVRYGSGHNCTIQTCHWWHAIRFIHFTKNWRASSNPAFATYLEDVGNGRVDLVEPPAECRVSSYTELIQAVYGDTWDCAHQILALTLETCAEVNALCFAQLPGTLTQIPASDNYIDCRDPDDFPHDYIESLDMKGAPPWMLQFKIGAKYMCIRNLDLNRGIVNGTMLRLLSFGHHSAHFEILTGKAKGSIEILTKSAFSINPEASGLPFTIIRKQYPIIPAYCLSVHKAQGQSLQRVGLIFESDPFTHGQLYVALSRVSGWNRVYTVYQGDNIKNHVLRHLLMPLSQLQP